ncbi:MAG: hypothetical protein GJT30_12350 [Geobacter sp.]|nr:hypothetical protein [Geobacter sp.]
MNYVDPDGLKWGFVGWRIEKGRKWWAKYRILIAKCTDPCSGKTKEITVYYQQWSLINVNVPQLSAPDYTASNELPGGAKDIADSAFDLIEAIKEAKEGTEEDKWKAQMLNRKGSEACDRLNLYWRKP